MRGESTTPATPALSEYHTDENAVATSFPRHRGRIPFSPLNDSYSSPRPPAYPSPAYPPWVSATPPSYHPRLNDGVANGKPGATGDVDLQDGGLSPLASQVAPDMSVGAPCESSSVGARRRRVEDLLLWAEPTKSALALGTGLFLFAMGYTMDPPTISFVTGAAYVALVYLAGSFTRRLARRGVAPPPASEWMSAADAERVARQLAALANAAASTHSALFCGSTAITLKVAVALWVASLLGSLLSVYTLLCLSFVTAFTLPLVYVRNVDSIHRKVVPLVQRTHAQWSQLPHGKPLTALGCVLVWSFFGVVTKLFLIFVAFLSVRLYQETNAKQVEAGVAYVRKTAKRVSQGARRMSGAFSFHSPKPARFLD